MTRSIRKAYALATLLSLLALPPSLLPSVKVGGFGLFGNAELRSSLRLLEIEDGPIDARKIDDGAFLLLTRLTQNGYLDARLSATYETPDGAQGSATWTTPFEAQIPEDVVADKLRYLVEEGTLYYYENVSIEGLASLEPDEARAYIIPDNALYSRKKDRAYSPSILSNHQKQLAAALVAQGKLDAEVDAEAIEIDETTGAVNVLLSVEEGPLYRVAEAEAHYLDGEDVLQTVPLETELNYTRNWAEDQAKTLRNESYRLGYPDTKVSSRIVKSTPQDDTVSVHVRFDVRRGPQIVLSQVEHRGATDTRTALLERKSDLQIGQPLDITQTEAARRRLSRLGIFDRIDLSYEDDGPGQRKAVYDYENGERIQVQLLVGYGSYEQFRAGLLARRENLFGRAHALSFAAVQSLKSTSGRLDYTVPELLGENVDGTAELNYLRREELFFDRTERGISLGLFRRIPKYDLDLALDYALDRKKSSDPQFNAERRLEDTDIGSIAFRATRSTLDNILYPTSGYEISSAIRYAAEELGGETEFMRPELSAAYHTQIGNRLIAHIGLKGGRVSSPGDHIVEIPDSERFLVGGENSLRGYRRGEAGPIDDSTGVALSAEAFALLNLELEYPLFQQLNFVLFADTARIWETTENTSLYDDLTSVGLGFRYNTIVGPVRLEYGHNINPRPQDPDGTFHLSIGFPF